MNDMLLALSVVGPQSVVLGPTAYKVFDQQGGSIGRIAGNDWTLPDPERFVSTRHATVAFEDGMYCLTDVSTNGTFLNGPQQAVSREQPVRLRDGDRIFIGNYEILVQLIDVEAPNIADAADAADAANAGNAANAANGSSTAAASTATNAPVSIPDGALDTILRTVVQGLIEVLQARSQVKGQFRVAMTNIRPVENNPLKFSRTVEDALQTLFAEQNPGYLAPTEAFREAFEDLAFHELAMLAGVRAAFNSMLAGFHPDRLEERYARRLQRTSFISPLRRLRYWSLYRTQFEEFEADPDAHFQLLFGEEFARAYAEQLESLQAAAREVRR
jgi:predicted component of type VI protein secretion system